jgi:hypothetical protein
MSIPAVLGFEIRVSLPLVGFPTIGAEPLLTSTVRLVGTRELGEFECQVYFRPRYGTRLGRALTRLRPWDPDSPRLQKAEAQEAILETVTPAMAEASEAMFALGHGLFPLYGWRRPLSGVCLTEIDFNTPNSDVIARLTISVRGRILYHPKRGEAWEENATETLQLGADRAGRLVDGQSGAVLNPDDPVWAKLANFTKDRQRVEAIRAATELAHEITDVRRRLGLIFESEAVPKTSSVGRGSFRETSHIGRPDGLEVFGARLPAVDRLLDRVEGLTDEEVKAVTAALRTARPPAPDRRGFRSVAETALRYRIGAWADRELIDGVVDALLEIGAGGPRPAAQAIRASLVHPWGIRREIVPDGWVVPSGHPVGLPEVDYGPNEDEFRRFVAATANLTIGQVRATANEFAVSGPENLLYSGSRHFSEPAMAYERVRAVVDDRWPYALKIARGLASVGLPAHTRYAIKDAAVATLAAGNASAADVTVVLAPWRRALP